MKYGIKEYKELLEKQLKVTTNDAPAIMSNDEAKAWVNGTKAMVLYALEMLPEIKED